VPDFWPVVVRMGTWGMKVNAKCKMQNEKLE
jgi:hypothetical protein